MTSTLALSAQVIHAAIREAAAAIREAAAAIREAAAAKTLPPYPDGITFRVRSHCGAQWDGIDIEALHVPRAWAFASDGPGTCRPSAAWSALEAALTGLAVACSQAGSRTVFIALTADPGTEIRENGQQPRG